MADARIGLKDEVIAIETPDTAIFKGVELMVAEPRVYLEQFDVAFMIRPTRDEEVGSRAASGTWMYRSPRPVQAISPKRFKSISSSEAARGPFETCFQ